MSKTKSKQRYTITITFEAEHVPSDMMDDLAEQCLVQVEGLNDGTMDDELSGQSLDIDYDNQEVKWKAMRIV